MCSTTFNEVKKQQRKVLLWMKIVRQELGHSTILHTAISMPCINKYTKEKVYNMNSLGPALLHLEPLAKILLTSTGTEQAI